MLNHRTVVCLKRRINLPWRASSSVWNIDDISQFIVFYVLDADQSWKLLLVYADHMTLKNTMFYNGLLWRFDAFLASYWIHLTRFIYWFNTSACYTCNAKRKLLIIIIIRHIISNSTTDCSFLETNSVV